MERSLPLKRERPFQFLAEFFGFNVFGVWVLRRPLLSPEIIHLAISNAIKIDEKGIRAHVSMMCPENCLHTGMSVL